MLSDAGYDIWMGNARGNRHSRAHRFLDAEGADFWDFSWQEIGKYDLPAMIDTVLSQTKQKTLHYVGHSQGCTSLIVMLCQRPEYNKKLITTHLLSPPVYMKHSKSMNKIFVNMIDSFEVYYLLFY